MDDDTLMSELEGKVVTKQINKTICSPQQQTNSGSNPLTVHKYLLMVTPYPNGEVHVSVHPIGKQLKGKKKVKKKIAKEISMETEEVY